MNYELAKKLKDAGFPQREVSHTGQHWVARDGYVAAHQGGDETECLIPTLEELIEACGDEFYSLVYATDNDWRAFSETNQWNTIATADGVTPTIAVANLWLNLQHEQKTED